MKTAQEREKEHIISLLFPEKDKRSAKEGMDGVSSWNTDTEGDWAGAPRVLPDELNYDGNPDLFMAEASKIDFTSYYSSVPGIRDLQVGPYTNVDGVRGHCGIVLSGSSSSSRGEVENAIIEATKRLLQENIFSSYDFQIMAHVEIDGTARAGRWDSEAEVWGSMKEIAPDIIDSRITSAGESFSDAQGLQSILSQIGITVRGEEERDDCINESAFDKESRCKSCDIVAVSEDEAKFTWYTQEEASRGPLDEFIRCLSYVLNQNNYTTPFSVRYIIESRDGPDYGSYKGTIYFDGKKVTEKASSNESLKKRGGAAKLKNVSSTEAVRYGSRYDFSYDGLGIQRFNKDFERLGDFLAEELDYPGTVDVRGAEPAFIDGDIPDDEDLLRGNVTITYPAGKGTDPDKFIADMEAALKKFFVQYKFSSYKFNAYVQVYEVVDDDNWNEVYFDGISKFFPAEGPKDTLEKFLKKIGVTLIGQPKRDDCINESALDSESRNKRFELYVYSDTRAKLEWTTQEWAYGTDVRNEVLRCLKYLIKREKYTSPFTLLLLVESRDGPDYGSYDYTFTFDGKTVQVTDGASSPPRLD